jgi:hypothetical protein
MNHVYYPEITLQSSPKSKKYPQLQVLTTITMKSTIFWDVMPYNSVDVHRRFGGTYCFHLHCRSLLDVCFLCSTVNIHAVRSSETVNYETTRRHIIRPLYSNDSCPSYNLSYSCAINTQVKQLVR